MPRPARLILVTRNLPPLRGGMERLNARMAQELSRDFEVTVVAPKGSLALGDAIALRTCPWAGLAAFLMWATFVTLGQALRQRPAWILGGSGLVAPIAWLAARLSGARIALYLHGLDIIVDNRVYRMAWLPFIRRVDRAITNSRHTCALACAAGVPAARVTIVNPGTSLPEAVIAPEVAAAFRLKHGLVGAQLLLSVGRLTARKGLASFVAHVLPAVVKAFPSAVLVVIGDDAQDALAGGDTSQRSQANAEAVRLGLQQHVRFLGPVSEDELIAAYAASDVHVFPVREVPGDVEGFGMVAIEAAAHGLPTVATAVGGVPDAVADGITGHLVQPDDAPAFAAAIESILVKGRAVFDTPARAFAARFAWPCFGEGVRAALKDGT
jgi:phosphatidylinositol alpha-1,6-mannosyltransferase